MSGWDGSAPVPPAAGRGRWGSRAALAVVGVIVLLGVGLTLWFLLGPRPTSGPGVSPVTVTVTVSGAAGSSVSAGPSSSAAPPVLSSSAGRVVDDSLCGLAGAGPGRVLKEPKTSWDGVPGVTWLFPTSAVSGPGVTDAAGVRSCFAHSPEGVVFWAGNAVLQAQSPWRAAWYTYVVADGPYKQQRLDSVNEPAGGASRVRIVAFRLVSYTAEAASVDVAIEAVNTAGQSATVSYVLDAVWQGGDWRWSTATVDGGSASVIPSVVGYVVWQAR